MPYTFEIIDGWNSSAVFVTFDCTRLNYVAISIYFVFTNFILFYIICISLNCILPSVILFCFDCMKKLSIQIYLYAIRSHIQ